MKKLMLAAIALMIGATVNAQDAPRSHVSVTGKVERKVVPNEIFIKITIDENTSKGKITVAEQEKQLIAALKKLGIDTAKDLQVGNIAGDLQTYVLRKDKTLTAKTYELKVKDANTLSKVFTALADLNVAGASVTKAALSNIEELRTELRVEAILNAQANARTLAEAIGQNIGKAITISEYNFSEPVVFYFIDSDAVDATPKAAAYNYSDGGLDFKNLTVTHNVSVMFELK